MDLNNTAQAGLNIASFTKGAIAPLLLGAAGTAVGIWVGSELKSIGLGSTVGAVVGVLLGLIVDIVFGLI